MNDENKFIFLDPEIYIICNNCNKAINKEHDFYKVFGEDLFYFEICNNEHNYLLDRGIDSEDFEDMYCADVFDQHDIEMDNIKNPTICGKCIESYRKHIRYITIGKGELMVFLAPHNFEF